MYDTTCVPHFISLSEDSIRTRGNKYKLAQHHCHSHLRKYTYTNRVIPVWNSKISDYVVFAVTLNTFKRRLNKCWSDKGVLYNYKAERSMASEAVVL